MTNKIRMTLLIDERSHPELYADLLGIDGDRNRTERVRYLAGIGLVLTKSNAPRSTSERPQLDVTQQISALSDDRRQGPATASASPPATHRGPLPEASREPKIPSKAQALGDLSSPKAGADSANEQSAPGAAPEETPAARAARQMARAGMFGIASPARDTETG